MPIVTVKPEVGLKNLTVPIGAIGGDDYRVPVGRNLDGVEFDVVEKFVECDSSLVGGERNARRKEKGEHNSQGSGHESEPEIPSKASTAQIETVQGCDPGSLLEETKCVCRLCAQGT